MVKICDDKNFQKTLAKAQVYNTALVTFGSMLSAFGIAVFIAKSTEGVFSEQVQEVFGSDLFFASGVLMMIAGVIVVCLGVIIPNHMIENAQE